MPVFIRYETETVSKLTISFGFEDDRGRLLGHTATITFVKVYAHEDQNQRYGSVAYGPYQPGAQLYTVRAFPTRNGQTYGASRAPVVFETQAEAEAYVVKAAADCRKRYAKKFAAA